MTVKIRQLIVGSIYFLVFLLPWSASWIWREVYWSGAKWQAGTRLFFATEILIWLIFAFSAAFYLTVAKTSRVFKNVKPGWRSPQIMAVVFLLWAGLTVFWSPDYFLALFGWGKLATAIILFCLILKFKLSRRWLAWSLALAAVGQSFLAIFQFFQQRVAANKWLGMAEQLPEVLGTAITGDGFSRWLRAYGSFNHPNILGGFLALGLCLIFYLYLKSASVIERRLSLFAAGLTAAGLFFSFSRGAGLALGVAFIVQLVIISLKERARQKKALFFMAYCLMVWLALALIFWPLLAGRLTVNDRLENKSISERLTGLNEGLTMISQSWLRGGGIANYTYWLYRQNTDWPGWVYQPVHNFYLLIWAELGLVGLLIFGWFLALIIFLIFKQRCYYGAGLLLILLLVGFFDHYWWTDYGGRMVFWFSLAWILRGS